jgi:RHS repeat-associated protein
VVNAQGANVDTYTYTPYGQASTVIGVPEPFGYTSSYTDAGTGLLKLGARYYDPTQNRFTQPDPQTHPGDINQSSPYPYAGDDPVNHVDPAGKDLFGDIVGAATGTLLLAGAIVGLAIAPEVTIPAGLLAAGGIGIGAGADAFSFGEIGCDLSGC